MTTSTMPDRARLVEQIDRLTDALENAQRKIAGLKADNERLRRKLADADDLIAYHADQDERAHEDFWARVRAVEG